MSSYLGITLCVLVCFASHAYSVHWVGTGRGLISAVPTGTGGYTIQEVGPNPWDYIYSDNSVEWTLEKDDRFPNGVFIRSVKYPTLVWDCQGNQFGAGTNVHLYTKKDTLATTKNQRWALSSANQYGIIYNVNMVANVTQTGKVVLANKSNSSFQKFYPTDMEAEMVYITFDNYMGYVGITVYSPIGIYVVEVDGSNNPSAINFFRGSFLVFDITPGFNYTVTTDEWITLPPPLPLPTTPTTWAGELHLDSEYAISMILTFSGSSFSGSGSDTKWGAFTVSGSQYSGLSLHVAYKTGGRGWSFQGVLVDDDGFHMSGEVQYFDSSCSCTVWGQLYLDMQ
jgi:hypothetical protein